MRSKKEIKDGQESQIREDVINIVEFMIFFVLWELIIIIPFDSVRQAELVYGLDSIEYKMTIILNASAFAIFPVIFLVMHILIKSFGTQIKYKIIMLIKEKHFYKNTIKSSRSQHNIATYHRKER